jgi:hypothetical protein
MSDSRTYHVLWEIDIEAESPIDAARQALRIQRDPDSTATVFDVTDGDGNTQRIDLDEADARNRCAACGREFDEDESIIQAPTGKTYRRECFEQGQG